MVMWLVFSLCCLEIFSPLLVVDYTLSVLVPQGEPLIIQSPFVINGASYIPSGILLIVVSWWSIVDSGDYWFVYVNSIDNGIYWIDSRYIIYDDG
jgi:hypothetical protein